MFNATLESVGVTLAETEAAVTAAVRELSSISGLTWHTMAGKAFIERSERLSGELAGLLEGIRAAQAQLAAASRELAELEERIMQLRLAG